MRWLLGLPIALFACTAPAKRDVAVRAANYSFDLTVTGVDLPDRGAEILYDDNVLGRVKPKSPSARVNLPDDVYLVEGRGRLRIRLDGTCGKQEIPLRIPFADKAEEVSTIRRERQSGTFEAESVPTARIYFDNDASPAVTFAVGSLNIDVSAGDRGTTTAILGTCATARQVLVGGTKVGELPSQPVASDAPLAALVDLKGGRCYRARVHLYSDSGSEKGTAPPPKWAVASAPEPPPAAKGKAKAKPAPPPLTGAALVLRGERVYPMGVLHDFLAPSPTQLVVHDDPKLLSRLELLHCEDAKGGKGATGDKALAVAKPAANVRAKAAAAPVSTPAKPKRK